MPRGHGLWTAGTVRTKKITVTHTQLQAAALTNDITIYTLAPKEMVLNIWMKHSVAFSGGLIATYTLSVGIIGSLLKYLAAKDVAAVVGDTVQYGLLTPAPLVESHANSTALRLSAISTVGNLDASVAGSVDVWVQTIILP